MNSQELTYLLQHPQTVSKEQTTELETILNEYPYFQSVRAVHLKGLKNQDSYKYNQALKITAAHTTDRSILFDFITSDTFLQNEVSKNIKHNLAYVKNLDVDIQDISVNKSVSIDDALRNQLQESEATLDPELFQPKVGVNQVANFQESQFENTESSAKQEIVSAESILEIGKPLEFNKTEKHSFNEWLKLTRFKPIDRSNENEQSHETEEASSTSDEARQKKYDLIDKFISTKPKINPIKETTNAGNLANERMIQPEALMTETLARIYVEQKNYEKAIQSYKILSLKYPEKSGFFADQIKAVKQLQEDQNIK